MVIQVQSQKSNYKCVNIKQWLDAFSKSNRCPQGEINHEPRANLSQPCCYYKLLTPCVVTQQGCSLLGVSLDGNYLSLSLSHGTNSKTKPEEDQLAGARSKKGNVRNAVD